MVKKYIIVLLLTVISSVAMANQTLDSVVVYQLNKPKNDLIKAQEEKQKNLIQRILPKPSYRRVSKPSVFVPKGQWIVGATLSYSENSGDNFKFLIADKIKTENYNVKTEVYFGYAFFNDAVIGMRAGYSRTLMDLGNIDINLSDDVNFNIKDYYSLNHAYVGTVFMRNYISLFDSKRFGLFNDLQLSVEQGQGKTMKGSGETLTGTYSTNTKFRVGISPGLAVFINDNAAFEASVGVLGFESAWIKQTTDQIETGEFRKSSANFKINLFSLKLGITFYLNAKKVNIK